MNQVSTFQFNVGAVRFNIVTTSRVNAYEQANKYVREHRLVHPSDKFAWFDGLREDSFFLGHDVFLD